MGYILTRGLSPDSPLIEACAKYVATAAPAGGNSAAGKKLDDVRNGLVRAISTMTATTPEGWRALAAAADNAAAHDGASGRHAAAMIFVMQCSLLGKRKRLRGQAPSSGAAAADSLNFSAPAGPERPPMQAETAETVLHQQDAVMPPPNPAPLPESEKTSASKKIIEQFRLACERAFAAQPASLPEKIRQHEAAARLNDEAWESLAAWVHIEMAAPSLGRLYATA